jgi:SNF2 family DNA or RNA helicase
MPLVKTSWGRSNKELERAELENGTEESESLDDEMDELYDMDDQQLLDELLSHVSALQSEGSHVETLLDAAVRCEQAGPDAKAEALIEWIYALQAEENEPDLKVLIFTEFVPTQQMLKEFLEARGISVVSLNGSMDMEERKQAQDAFRKSHRMLVSTDAGAEVLNLFAYVIINYDIPWNPMRLEQRIGRVDRIGQPKTVRAINFVFEDSVEFRVREVLEQKLSVIFDEFGVDKTGNQAAADAADCSSIRRLKKQ